MICPSIAGQVHVNPIQVELLVVYSKVAILQNGGTTVWTHTDMCLCGDG